MDTMLAYSPNLTLINSLVAIYKIYVLKDPFTDEVFYVGQTQQELNIRLSGHMSESRAINPKKRAKFDEIINKGGKPIIEAVEIINGTCYIDKLHVNSREFHWIKFYRLRQARLTNAVLITDESESKDFKHYMKSIKQGQGFYRYYFCGKTPAGHAVYDENRMRADGFRLPNSPATPTTIVEKIVEKIIYLDCPKVATVHIPELPIQPDWTDEFRVAIAMCDRKAEDFIEDEDECDYEGEEECEIDDDLEEDSDFEPEFEESDESDYEPDEIYIESLPIINTYELPYLQLKS